VTTTAPADLRYAHRYLGPSCPRCAAPLARLPTGVTRCGACQGEFEAISLEAPPPAVAVERIADAGPDAGAACPAHAGNLAVDHCGRCGLLVCGLCRIELGADRLCPSCFDRLRASNALPAVRSRWPDYATRAATLVALGMFICYFMPFTGGAGLYYGVRALKQKKEWGDVGGRARIWLIMGVAALQVLALVGVLVAFALAIVGAAARRP
jgi:hypothetical protein